MVTRRENIKRYIKVIVEQLSDIVTTYSSKDSDLLLKFLHPLQHFEKADFNRPALTKMLHDARSMIINHDDYLNLPFSWFAETYFENAEITLQISLFHADQFYDYILTILKGTNKDGVFHLLHKQTPLNSLEWEELQYKSAKLRVPLKSYQLQILKTIYTFLKDQPLDAFRPNRLHTYLLNQHDIPRLTGELPKFLQLLNAKWSIWPDYSSFNLETYFFKLKLSNSTPLVKFIDFKDQKNQVLTTSIVYSIREKGDELLGILILPEGLKNRLISFLNGSITNSIIEEYSLERVIENQWSYSLSQYQIDSGWQELTKSAWKSRSRILSSITQPRRRKNIPLTYITPMSTSSWTLQKLKDPYEAIKLICRPNEYTYSDLNHPNFTPKEFQVLKKLYSHNAILIDFYAFRLGLEFSLDSYWLETPNFTMYQLTRLLDLLPYARLARTAEKVYIHCYLTPMMVKRIKTELDWPIYPVLPIHTGGQRDEKMFDKQSLQWNYPLILKE
jgi:hypothetical protein